MTHTDKQREIELLIRSYNNLKETKETIELLDGRASNYLLDDKLDDMLLSLHSDIEKIQKKIDRVLTCKPCKRKQITCYCD